MNLVAVAHVWNQAPLTSLLILAGLQSMPENLHRAARIDGAGAVRRFFSITLPWLRPMLLLVLILTSINSIMAFDLFWTMTHGGPGSATTVFSWMGYAYAFQFFRFGEGAAILYVLTIVCLILAWFYLKLFLPPSPRGRKRAGSPNRRRIRCALAACGSDSLDGLQFDAGENSRRRGAHVALRTHAAHSRGPGPCGRRTADLRLVIRAIFLPGADESLAVVGPGA